MTAGEIFDRCTAAWVVPSRNGDRLRAEPLAATSALKSVWPTGCILDGHEWTELEEAVTVAYWSENVANLEAALVDRDAYALDAFGAYRAERAT